MAVKLINKWISDKYTSGFLYDVGRRGNVTIGILTTRPCRDLFEQAPYDGVSIAGIRDNPFEGYHYSGFDPRTAAIIISNRALEIGTWLDRIANNTSELKIGFLLTDDPTKIASFDFIIDDT